MFGTKNGKFEGAPPCDVGKPGVFLKSFLLTINRTKAYAPVVCLMEKTWLLRAEKFYKARST